MPETYNMEYTLDGVTRKCRTIRSERTESIILNTKTGQTWAGIRFLIEFEDGTQDWTTTFPDTSDQAGDMVQSST